MPNIASESNSYNRQGDYELLRLEITSNRGGSPIDLTPQFIDLVLYETIFDTKMIGEVAILDSLNYSETIPITGNETLRITYKTKGADYPIDIIGRVFTIFGKSRTTNEKSEVYKMQFVSEVQYQNSKVKICCSKKGTMDKIVKSIFAENFGWTNTKLELDPVSNKNFQFIFPYWSPLYSMNWLSNRCFAPGHQNSRGPSYYTFYEDIDGFHFVDLVARSALPVTRTYRFEPNNANNISDVNLYFEKVQDYNVSSYFDRLLEHKTGMYSGYLMTHDITKKKMEYQEFDYHSTFEKANHLNEEKLISNSDRELVDSKLGFVNYFPIQTRGFDGIDRNDNPQDYFSERASTIRQFNTIKLSLLVNGNSTLRLLDVINFEIPKIGYMQSTEKDWEDIYLGGKYIITSLKHTINRDAGYSTTMELAKDSLIKGIPDSFE